MVDYESLFPWFQSSFMGEITINGKIIGSEHGTCKNHNDQIGLEKKIVSRDLLSVLYGQITRPTNLIKW